MMGDNFINKLINSYLEQRFVDRMPYILMLALWFCVLFGALRKRLWLLPTNVHPSRLFALNAGTLALLGIAAKVDKPWYHPSSSQIENLRLEYYLLFCNVLICAVVGALMPSIAASTDIKDTWSNVLGITVLILSTNFFIFLQFFYEPIIYDYEPTIESKPIILDQPIMHGVVMAFLILLLLVIIVQTTALAQIIADIKSTVLEQLEQLCMEAKPGYKADVVVQTPDWSWKTVERNTNIKLMMVLTSNPQNVLTRSPCVAIVGTIFVCCITTFHTYIKFIYQYEYLLVWAFGMISVWRWVRVSLQEERSFSSLLSTAEPSYWRRKMNKFQSMLKAGPYAARCTLRKKVVYGMAAFFVLYVVIPLHWLLVAMIRVVHIFSVLLLQKFFWLPLNKSLQCGILISMLMKRLFKAQTQAAAANNSTVADDSTANNFRFLGVVCLEGEDAANVQREFASAHNLIIQTQLKKGNKYKSSHLQDLIIFLQEGIKDPSSLLHQSHGNILDVLHHDGAPYVENLHVEHGYQYGWGLTMVALLDVLTEIEVTALGKSVKSDAAMKACCQAMEMMQVVDEQFVPCIVCTKETYARACASEWFKLAEKLKKWRCRSKQINKVMPQVKPVDEILMHKLEPLKRHMEEFNKTRSTTCAYAAATWPQQIVVSYTMHTVFQNLSRCCSDLEKAATPHSLGGGDNNAMEMMQKAMVEHINALLAEVLACCLLNLCTALDMSTTEAVLHGSVSNIEKALFLVAQGKHVWEELQWPPTLHSSKNLLTTK